MEVNESYISEESYFIFIIVYVLTTFRSVQACDYFVKYLLF